MRVAPLKEERSWERPTGSVEAAKRSILVVEDHELVRELERLILEEHGYRVDAAPHAEAALERLAQSSYDLVLTDLRLPGAGGFALIRAIRSHAGAAAQTAVLVLSAHAMPDDVAAAKEAGADAFLAKPFTWDMLASTVAETICGSGGRAARAVDRQIDAAPS